MSEVVITYTAAIADFINGDLVAKTVGGTKLILSLGPAQVEMLKRGIDRYVAESEAKEMAPHDRRP